ncbi:MAG: glycosyltransferase, partial [Lentisphaerae bacterium]|nr:glycosyltransferase [Lentisphaerota bacterium]
TGYVTDQELLALYRDADVLSHASKYEGFGLQILEAMACGTPVVCSNTGSLPEVTGEAAIMLDPNDSSGFAREIARVLGDSSVSNRMSQAGIKQAAQFTWERAARETISAYETVHAGV